MKFLCELCVTSANSAFGCWVYFLVPKSTVGGFDTCPSFSTVKLAFGS
jgi:hypothetical protein